MCCGIVEDRHILGVVSCHNGTQYRPPALRTLVAVRTNCLHDRTSTTTSQPIIKNQTPTATNPAQWLNIPRYVRHATATADLFCERFSPDVAMSEEHAQRRADEIRAKIRRDVEHEMVQVRSGTCAICSRRIGKKVRGCDTLSACAVALRWVGSGPSFRGSRVSCAGFVLVLEWA